MRANWSLVAAALALVVSVGHAQSTNRDEDGTASIAGSVVRYGTSEIVEGAAVVLIDDLALGPNRSTTTTAFGAFKFDRLRPGRYELAVTMPGSVRGAWGADKPERIGQPIVLMADQHADGFRVPLFAGAVVAGTVWSPDNQPVAHARVSALRKRYLSGGRVTIATEASASTDDRGRYRIFGLPPDEYVISALPSQAQSATSQMPPTFFPGTTRYEAAQPMRLEPGDERLNTDIRFSLASTGAVHVQVRAADGSSLDGLRVQVSLALDYELAGVFMPRTVTGADVVVPDVLPGRYRVSASAVSPTTPVASSNGVTLSGNVVINVAGGAQRDEVSVAVKHLARVSGSVSLHSTRTPPRTNLGSVRVSLTTLEATADKRRYDSAPNSTMQFGLAAIPPGRYQIDAIGIVAGGALQPWTLRAVLRDEKPLDGRVIDLGSDDVGGLDLSLVDDLAVFSGSLLNSEARPAPPHFIVLVAKDADATGAIAAYYTRPAIDGSFRIGNVLDGTYAVAIAEDMRPDDLNDPAQLAALRASSVLTLTLAPGEERRQNLQVR